MSNIPTTRGLAQILSETGDNPVKIYFHVKGNLKAEVNPVILFVHGFGADSTMWDQQRECFSGAYPTISIDLRGFGLSDKPLDSPYSFKMFSEDIRAILSKLDIDSVIYVGADIGASLGIYMATEPDTVVEQLILLSPSLHLCGDDWPYAEFSPKDLPNIWRDIQTHYKTFTKRFILRTLPVQPNTSMEKACRDMSSKIPKEVLLRILGQDNPDSFIFTDLSPLIRQLDQSKIPIFLGFSRECPQYVRGNVAYLFYHLQTANPIIYDFIEHGIYSNMSDPDRFNLVLNNFLDFHASEGSIEEKIDPQFSSL